MARDDEKEKSRKRWGLEEDELDENGKSRKENENNSTRIDDLIRRVEPLIEQVNSLYTQFIAGVESLPPNERRNQLDQSMATLMSIPKPNQTYRFRANTIHTRYVTFKDRWDKLLRDLESGKIKRRIPGKG